MFPSLLSVAGTIYKDQFHVSSVPRVVLKNSHFTVLVLHDTVEALLNITHTSTYKPHNE